MFAVAAFFQSAAEAVTSSHKTPGVLLLLVAEKVVRIR
jgi:hypothetical protein